MKRRTRIIRLCVFLVAGAIINVAVAWYAVLSRGSLDDLRHLFPDASREFHSMSPADSAWYSLSASKIAAENALVMPHMNDLVRKRPRIAEWHGSGLRLKFVVERFEARDRWKTAAQTSPEPRIISEGFCSAFRVRAGLPVDSLQMSVWRTTIIRPTLGGIPTQNGWTVPQSIPFVPPAERVVPLNPLWPGFAINTIFYAAVLWLLFAAPGKIRRIIRGRRGQCPACAYPIGSSTVCTECGWPVPAATSR